MNVTGKSNSERVSVLHKMRSSVTLRYELDGEIVTRSGRVERVDVVSDKEENWAVEISQPLAALGVRTSARIGIDQLTEIIVGTSAERVYI